MKPISNYPITFTVSNDYYQVMALDNEIDGIDIPIDITNIDIAGRVTNIDTGDVQVNLTVTKLDSYYFAIAIAKVDTAQFSPTVPYTYSIDFTQGGLEFTYIQGDCVPTKKK